jgi:adenine-specific DNA-methyltransferase
VYSRDTPGIVVLVERCYDPPMDGAWQWAQRLGMAMVSPLFPAGTVNLSGEHSAMLDGRRASFACSTVDAPEISLEDSRNWQWSADLAHHVLITPKTVWVRSGREPLQREFKRESVDSRLEEFLTFLDSPRRSALPDVVSFLVEEFQQIWVASGSPDGATALLPFLLSLSASDSGHIDDSTWRRQTALDIGIDDPDLLEAHLNSATIERARGMQGRAPLGLRLIPSLVLRHAAGRLFQEAHAVIETAQPDLFGNFQINKTPTYSPAGAYFTPVPLARLLADWALPRKSFPDELTIADYACGSAVFLTEALRTLERRAFKGTVRLVGRDKSPQAVRMAKVAIRSVERDLQGMTVISNIEEADALESEWPNADFCLMNPPFRSWEGMNERERSWVQEVTKSSGHGRPDLSVGFIERAMRSLRPTGVLATLVPAGVLASDSLSRWRNELIQRGTPTLVAVLGDHALFEHALVNIGILSLQNGASSQTVASKAPLYVAWSSAQSGAAARVIRAIRRSISDPTEPEALRKDANGWSITATTVDAWKRRPSWLPGAGALGTLLENIQASTITKVGDLFDVRQGIRTGANPIFIQPASVVSSLPAGEQRYFKKAVDAASFVDGEIKPNKFLFYVPRGAWKTEEEFSKAVPEFFNRYIRPSRDVLQQRKSLRSKNECYWELTRARGWMFKGRPRLVSKRFGLYPAFAKDFGVEFAVVQANAWVPKDAFVHSRDVEQICEMLTAYWWLLNSRVAVALFREFCPNVAGGQLDLENKYVKNVPLPNLFRQFSENPTLPVLANSIRSRYPSRLPTISDRDQFAATTFGTDLSEWKFSGLEMAY